MREYKRQYILREHETLEGVELASASAEMLRREFSYALTLRPSVRGGWELKAGSHIGRIELKDASIRIQPKLPADIVWEWLARAYDIRSLRFYQDRSGFTEKPGDLEWLVKLFIAECRDIVRRGLCRGYVSRTEKLGGVRGQLAVPETLRLWSKQEYRFGCTYDEHTERVPENGAIYAALYDMERRSYHDASIRWEIKELMRLFVAGRESEEQRGRPRSARERLVEVERIPITRLNRHYADALSLLRLYWRAAGLSMHAGHVYCESFVLDMNELFERYIARLLSEELRPHGIKVRIQTRHWLGEGGRLVVIPDILLQDTIGREIVLDTKYTERARGYAEHPHVYQMLAYMTARRADTGILLYASGPECVDRIRNTGQTIYRWSLGLDVPLAVSEHEQHTKRIIARILRLFY
ncbi:hypothetical protein P4S83_02800 [Aneurinibacillus thermoaerophilus]|uniref:McrC family protein n=1 Tax=Aneurinibacillus thermoaerophilus TaxID=143495 RepID=UPI002E1E8FC2|nr:hypothetical protein [Aneurinibacillus thermoaerophilus]MED0765570.1 hypothetical protein [Aneurinibacillus thermoaerophilus]